MEIPNRHKAVGYRTMKPERGQRIEISSSSLDWTQTMVAWLAINDGMIFYDISRLNHP